jgi:hypothetical protein
LEDAKAGGEPEVVDVEGATSVAASACPLSTDRGDARSPGSDHRRRR